MRLDLVVVVGLITFLLSCQSNPPSDYAIQLPEMSLVAFETPASSELLIEQLRCNSCHSGLFESENLRNVAPDLSHAGLRYRSSYLFEYLQNPNKVRNHIGSARMPNFGFSARESLALTKFLATQTVEGDNWPELPKFSEKISEDSDAISRGKDLFGKAACITCHATAGGGSNLVSNLTDIGSKLKPKWLKEFLAAPEVFRGEENQMPNYFFEISEDKKSFKKIHPQAMEIIEDIAEYLMSTGLTIRSKEEARLEKIEAENVDVTIEMGRNIFLGQNCAACHRASPEGTWREKTAPNLGIEAMRVQQTWLQSFLKEPHAIRPFGFLQASGSRMPNFNLTDAEVDSISSYLMDLGITSEVIPVDTLSVFSMNKATRLMEDKLSCLGCHRFGEMGGMIGPNLANLKGRLKPNYISAIIDDPHTLVPENVMPRIPMPPSTRQLLVPFLLQNKVQEVETNYLSLTDNPIVLPQENDSYKVRLYLNYCASCHGIGGDGDGFNASFLPTKPTMHSDPEHMSTRPDDTLFDGVFVGGYILNKSQTMPPWGQTLGTDDIMELVEYMRDLCDCQGPEWSRDNNKN